jgi:hypothetical protein
MVQNSINIRGNAMVRWRAMIPKLLVAAANATQNSVQNTSRKATNGSRQRRNMAGSSRRINQTKSSIPTASTAEIPDMAL